MFAIWGVVFPKTVLKTGYGIIQTGNGINQTGNGIIQWGNGICPDFGSNILFYKIFPIWSEDSKTISLTSRLRIFYKIFPFNLRSFRNRKWNYSNRKWNYFSNFQTLDQKTSFTKCFPLNLTIPETGSGIMCYSLVLLAISF